jgi:predicted NodU family carbamoyl transferase
MVSVTSRVQLGESRQETTSRLMVAYTFHIRSESSTKPLHNTSAFPIMATNTRSWGLRPMAADVARSAQAMYEEAFFHLLGDLQRRSGLTDLALAGGCAMNSVANGKVRRNTPFRRVYVQSAAGDAGGAIGSAFAIWHKLGGKRNFVMDHAYWGACV